MGVKIFGWLSSSDYQIHITKGTRGKYRWTVLNHGDAVALSPVKGWATWEEARDAARAFLDGVGADHLKMQSIRPDRWLKRTDA